MDPDQFFADDHQLMTDLLTNHMIDFGLSAKSIIMEEVENANTPYTNSDRDKPINVHFRVMGNQREVRSSLSQLKSMMSKGTMHKQLINKDEKWYDVSLIDDDDNDSDDDDDGDDDDDDDDINLIIMSILLLG